MSQTALARGQTPATNTHSNLVQFAEPLQQAGRKRRELHADPPTDPPHVGPSGHGGGGGGGNSNPGGDPNPDPDPNLNPPPGGPPSGPAGGNPGNPGGNPGGGPGSNPGGGGDGGGGRNGMDREDFIEAIITMTRALRLSSLKPKAKKSETFDGSDP